MGVDDVERKSILTRECADAEKVWRSICHLEEAEATSAADLNESPIKPWILDQAQLVFFYTTRKSSFLIGGGTGTGLVLARLPSPHPSLIRWSSPLFITLSYDSIGISFGRQTKSTMAVATGHTARHSFLSTSGRKIRGMDFNLSCGSGLSEGADIISSNFSGEDIGMVGVSHTSGGILDLSFFVSGGMEIDTDKCSHVYGPSVAPAEILAQQGPAEFQPLYTELSRVVTTVEHPTFNPARVSASLERFSAGKDPERVMVLPDGVVVREDLMQPPPTS